MNSYYHAVIAAKKHGGMPEDYQPLYDFIDSSKASLGDVRHRAILHSTFGIFICEKVFGHTITNAEGKNIPTRILAEEHIMDDLGFIPTVEHWLGELPIRKWMGGSVKKTKTVVPVRNYSQMGPCSEGIEPLSTVNIYKKSLKVKGD